MRVSEVLELEEACHRDFDKFGDHALSCQKPSHGTRTTTPIRHAITAYVKTSAAYARSEFVVARRPAARDGAQGSKIIADHLVILDNKVIWLDNATICPTARSAVSAAARNRRAALLAKQDQKHAIYDPHAAASQQACFFALINESGGAVNKEWHLLHKMLLQSTGRSHHHAIKKAYTRLMTFVYCLTAKGYVRSIAESLRKGSIINLLEQHSCAIIVQG